MRGHVKKKNGRWYVVLELEREGGKRKQKWISPQKELGLSKPANKPQAEQLLALKLKELYDGTYFEPAEMKLEDYLLQWLKDYAEINVKQKTLDIYENMIFNHIIPEIGSIKIASLRPSHVQSLLSSKLKGGRADGKAGGLSNRTVQYIHMVLKLALKHAVKWEIVHRNVAEVITPPRQQKKQINTWDREEAKTFLQAVKGHRLYPLYLLALTTGMRRGEILGLRWKDVNIKKCQLVIRQNLVSTKVGSKIQSTKTDQSQRTIDVSPSVAAELQKHRKAQMQEFEPLTARGPLNDQGLVFTSQAGTPIIPRNLYRHFNSVVESLNIKKVSFHGLRHTYASLLLEDGEHPKSVSERLGHSGITITLNTYSHVLPRISKETAKKTDYLL